MDVVKGQGFWTSLAKNLKELVLDEAPESESFSTPPVRRSKEDPLTSRDVKREASTKSPLSRSKSQQQVFLIDEAYNCINILGWVSARAATPHNAFCVRSCCLGLKGCEEAASRSSS